MEQEKRIGCLGVRVPTHSGLAEPLFRPFLIARNPIACRVKSSELQLRGVDAAFGRALKPFNRAFHVTFDAGAVEVEDGDVESGSRVTIAGCALKPSCGLTDIRAD